MSARVLLTLAAEGRLVTGPDGNPWGETRDVDGREASTEITVALWDVGLLSLPKERDAEGRRHWQPSALGELAVMVASHGPLGHIPPPGGPYE